MRFSDAKLAIEIFERYPSKIFRDWGDEENRKQLLEWYFDFGYEQCWLHLPRSSSNPPLTSEEQRALSDAGWFFDEDSEAWSHF